MADFLMGWTGLILGFSGLIFIHELGHFILAKWNGVRVHVFSLGMGPYLFSFNWRGTVYALSMIPIGGYVKMMGQDDLRPDEAPTKDAHDYRNKRPGQKAAILAAGAIFNLLFTLFAFAVCYTIGFYVTPADIGNIAPDVPLAKAYMINEPGKKVPAKLQKGDRILEVGGVPVKQFIDASLQIAGASKSEPLTLKVERRSQPAIHGQAEISIVYVDPVMDAKMGASGVGLEKYIETVKLPLGFSTEDVVVVADDLTVNAKLKEMPAAKAGLKMGDEILEIRDSNAPDVAIPIKSPLDIVNAVHASDGRKLTFMLKRDGKELQKVLTPERAKEDDPLMVGILSGLKRRVSEIDTDSVAYKAGLRAENYVLKFEPEVPNDKVWKSGKLVWIDKWTAKPDEKDLKKAAIIVPEVDVSRIAKGIYTEEKQAVEFYSAGNFWDGLHAAWEDTIQYSLSVFTVFKGLILGRVKITALSGPIGIGSAIHTVASTQSFLNFFWFMGFISLNLGVMQFAPIPLLDGWHLVLVAVEKLKGSPVSMKFQEYSQVVGLVVVGCLMLLATYQDILRTFFPS